MKVLSQALSLQLVCGILLFASTKSSAKPGNDQPAPKVPFHGSLRSAPLHAAAQSALASPSTNPEVKKAMAPLFAHRDWKRFRAAWRKLDAMPLPDNDPFSTRHASSNAVPANALGEQCIRPLKALEKTTLAQSIETTLLETLEHVVWLRVRVLAFGFREHLGMEPASLVDCVADDVVTAMERRIDILLTLRKKGTAGRREMASAQQAIASQLLLVVAWKKVTTPPALATRELNSSARLVQKLWEIHAKDSLDSLEQKLAEMEKEPAKERELGDLSATLPQLRQGIAEARRLASWLAQTLADLES
jgi:hypothetical protein